MPVEPGRYTVLRQRPSLTPSIEYMPPVTMTTRRLAVGSVVNSSAMGRSTYVRARTDCHWRS
jgi:hypothetical protein